MISKVLRRSFLVLIFGAAVALIGSSAYGYALENKSWPAGSIVTVQMELGSPSQALVDGSATWNEAAAPALYDWNAEMNDVEMVAVMDSTQPVSSGDGINSASFSSTVFGDSFGSGVLAVTYYRTLGETMMEADVLFNDAQFFDSYRGDLIFNSQGKCICDIRRVFLHELGHALGLTHPDSAGQKIDAVMNSIVSNRSLLAPDDIQGIQYLYGAPAASPTPTPTPLPDTPSRLVQYLHAHARRDGRRCFDWRVHYPGRSAQESHPARDWPVAHRGRRRRSVAGPADGPLRFYRHAPAIE